MTESNEVIDLVILTEPFDKKKHEFCYTVINITYDSSYFRHHDLFSVLVLNYPNCFFSVFTL